DLAWRVVYPGGLAYRVAWTALPVTYPAGDAGDIYLRKRLFLAATVRRCWLKVAALDQVELYVNGTSLGQVTRVGTMAAGVYEIGNLLVAGENVIAVESHKVTYPGTTRVLVE